MADVNGDFNTDQVNATASAKQDGTGGDFSLVQTASRYSAAISGSTIGAGGALTYRMRGYDGTLGRNVFWLSVVIDIVGTQYTGPGPLSNVVIYNIIGH